MEEVVRRYKPRTYSCSFSGGKDSLVATHFVWTWLNQQKLSALFEVVHVNTGIGLPTTLSYVRSVCQNFGWKLVILRPKHDFLSMVERQGMPAPNRRWCRYYLKLEPLIRHVRFLRPPVIQITGIRAKESSARLRKAQDGNLHQLEWRGERGCFLFSPIFWWDNKSIDEYINSNKLPVNPNYEIISASGDCICIPAATKKDLFRIARAYPNSMEIFMQAESRLKSGGSAFYDRENKRRLYVSELLTDSKLSNFRC